MGRCSHQQRPKTTNAFVGSPANLMKFLRYAAGVFSALLLIYFWPSHREVASIHLHGYTNYSEPWDISEHSTYVEFNAHDHGEGGQLITVHVHWQGSYYLVYK